MAKQSVEGRQARLLAGAFRRMVGAMVEARLGQEENQRVRHLGLVNLMDGVSARVEHVAAEVRELRELVEARQRKPKASGRKPKEEGGEQAEGKAIDVKGG